MDLSLEEKDSLSKSFPQKSQGESGHKTIVHMTDPWACYLFFLPYIYHEIQPNVGKTFGRSKYTIVAWIRHGV